MRQRCSPYHLIEHDGEDLRDLPLTERKRRLKKLLGGAKERAIQLRGAS
jgi:ATP-dependent DNA ligase